MLNFSDPHRGFNLEGIDAHLSLGLLLSPEAFFAEAERTRQQPLVNTWAVAAQMPDSVVRMLSSDLVPRGSAHGLVRSARGVVYPVVSLQAAGLQVRILCCLADPATREWFRTTREEGCVKVAMELPDAEHIAVVSVPCPVMSKQEVEGIIDRCTRLESEEAIADASHIVGQLSQRSAMPSLVSGFQTNDVRLICTNGVGAGVETPMPEPKERVLN